MDTPQTDLLQDFTQVTRTFDHLSRRLTDVAEQVRTAGILPSEDLIEEIAISRRSFTELRDKALELAGLLADSSVKTHANIGSIKDLETFLQAVTEAQRKKVQDEKIRLRALTILDRILSLIHREQSDFQPLEEVRAKAKALREAIRAFHASDVYPDANALTQGRHPLAEFLNLVEGYDDLDDDLWLLLQHAVAENFGKALAMSAARGKLCPSPTRLAADRLSGEHRNNQQPAVLHAAFTDSESQAAPEP